MAIILKPENVAQLVLFIRGEKVLLDADLAKLYGVTTKALNQAVKRNSQRFPSDFMFQLTKAEHDNMRSQIVTTSQRKSHSRSQDVTLKRGQNVKYLPYAFIEQGVAMLSSVLRSSRAVQVNIAIMRTFVQLRRLMDSNADLASKIESLEKKYDEKFATVFAAIKQLIAPTEPAKKRIGFHPELLASRSPTSDMKLVFAVLCLPRHSLVRRRSSVDSFAPAHSPRALGGRTIYPAASQHAVFSVAPNC